MKNGFVSLLVLSLFANAGSAHAMGRGPRAWVEGACPAAPLPANFAGTGLIGGLEGAPRASAVVTLRGDESRCTGAIVGTEPLTIITARHCVVGGARNFEWIKPSKVIMPPAGEYKFEPDKGLYPGDLAILVFDRLRNCDDSLISADIFSVAPVSLNWGTEISICGHGTTGNRFASGPTGYRCGQSHALLENPAYEFPEVAEIEKRADRLRLSFSDLSTLEQDQVVHASVQKYLGEYGQGSRVAAGLLSDAPEDVVPNAGDSGGPWFVDVGSTHHLIGISSKALVLSRNEVIAGVGWRLDHPWSKKFLKKARDAGADIRGLDELLKEGSER